MAGETKNIFISHIHEDDNGLQKLKDLVSNHGMGIRDYSINSSNPNDAKNENYIKYNILAPRIDQCSALVVYITPGTKDSKWVDWEIDYAERTGKRIVGVWAYGQNGCEVPAGLEKLSDAIVGWNGSSIIDTINGEVDGWENPDGTPAKPRDIIRYSCR